MMHSSKKEPEAGGWTARPFPEAARALRTRSPRIVDLWEEAVRRVLPAAEHLTLAQLRDHVPLIVDQLIAALESGKAEDEARLEDTSRPHGDVRFHQAYNVEEVMIEYGLLRRIVLKEMAAELARPLSDDEAAAVNVGLDVAQRRGVVAFVNHLGSEMRASEELQSAYISHLNHDLRGGMNGILLMVEVLKRELSTYPQLAEAAEDLEAMRRSVLESVATMDRFVYAHKLGRGKQPTRFATLDVKAMLQEVTSALGHNAAERRVQFSIDAEADSNAGCALESDKDLVRLIFYSILSNTVKHARREGGKVTITARPRPGGGCHFTFTDDGPGIAPEVLGKVLAVTPPGKDGRGIKLGLPVSKLAADKLGATLAIESVVGKGTTVRLEIPNRGVGTV